ncbi:MAG: hypothetical protein NTY41_18780 [Proteobacteria bacterium]|nr:hypothetical protein [Pseudomonadota bacterium]
MITQPPTTEHVQALEPVKSSSLEIECQDVNQAQTVGSREIIQNAPNILPQVLFFYAYVLFAGLVIAVLNPGGLFSGEFFFAKQIPGRVNYAIWESMSNLEQLVLLAGILIGLPALIALSTRLTSKACEINSACLAGAGVGVVSILIFFGLAYGRYMAMSALAEAWLDILKAFAAGSLAYLPVFLARSSKMKKVPKGFFLGSVAVGLGIADVLVILGSVQALMGNPETGLGLIGLSWLPMLYGCIVMVVLWYKMWAAIQDGNVRTTPGKAIGFLFIPFFNIYWAFQAIWGYAKDFNKYIDRHGIKTRQLPEGLFLTFTILCFTSWIPILGLVLVAVNYFIGLVVVSRICDGVNAIASSHSTE